MGRGLEQEKLNGADEVCPETAEMFFKMLTRKKRNRMANKGITFERELKQLLESAGFSVMRGAGSKGSVFNEKADLIATKVTDKNTKTAHMLVIQCKVKGVR